jgi:uncharacterized protein YqeY
MTIKEQLMNDMKEAMKAREMDKLGTIRFLMSEIKNYEIDNGAQDDAGIEKVIAGQIKKMNDAVVDYEKGGRSDLVEGEQAKIVVLKKYLPEQLSDNELKTVIEEKIAQLGKENMGMIIGAVTKEVGSKADGSRVAALVRETFAN